MNLLSLLSCECDMLYAWPFTSEHITLYKLTWLFLFSLWNMGLGNGIHDLILYSVDHPFFPSVVGQLNKSCLYKFVRDIVY